MVYLFSATKVTNISCTNKFFRDFLFIIARVKAR